MFRVRLKDITNPQHSLILLAAKIDWAGIKRDFEKYYSKEGRPSVPTRTMVDLLMLKSMFDESDEALIPRWIENPYWQSFCGEQYFRHDQPCDPSDLVHFRKRIKEEGHEYLLRLSARIHDSDSQEETVLIDSTVQEKGITFPTDAKLAIAILKECWKLAENSRLKLHQSFTRKTDEAKLKLRFGNHPKRKKEAKKAVKDLREYARKVIQQLQRGLPSSILASNKDRFEMYHKVLTQQKSDKNKIYSLHEPDVYCMSKGKTHKAYEFGCKVSVASTANSGIIVGITSFKENSSDVHTLEQALNQISYVTGHLPKEAICDRGYRGKKQVQGRIITIPKPLPQSSTRYQKEKVRIKFRRRASIEPLIGHLKYDHRMNRNFLKGIYGDFVNCVLAAAGFNLKKMLRKIASSLDNLIRWAYMLIYCLGGSKKVGF